LAREERQRDREREKELRQEKEKDQQYDLKKLRLTETTKRMELRTKLKQSLDRSNNTGDGNENEDECNEGKEIIDFGAMGIGGQGPRIEGPKMASFDERDDMGSYIHRFERYAVLQGWRKRDWAVYLAALSKGKALDVYARLPPEHAQDYDELKQALLKRYALTEEGYKQKFYDSKQEKRRIAATVSCEIVQLFLKMAGVS